MTVNDKHRKPSDMQRSISLLLVIAMLATIFVVSPFSVSAADPDYEEFSAGAVLLDASYSGKNVLIKNGVFSVTVSGATNVNIIFESVTMDRRYASDTNGTIEGLYNVSTALGWGNTAQTCPLLLTNNASATVAFRGVNNFYAGTNGCTVSNTNYYTKKQTGGGFAGIQVESGSTLTIAQSGGTLNVHGGYWVDADNSNNVPNTSLYENDGNGYGWPSGAKTDLSGGAGIGGGAAWNTTTSASQNYTAGTPGTIIINGGNINAHGGHQAAGIGGGLNSAATSTSITINGGNVVAYGGRWAPGIGDGDSLQNNWTTKCTDSYSIVINGGTIQATGGVNCPGIGTTDEVSANQPRKDTSGLTIYLKGGEITARSGYPNKFNPKGTTGYTGKDAAAAIGAGNNTNMHSNSIHVSSAAKIIASGFGHYSVTENGVNHETLPTVNIDSDSYAFLGRFPELTSHTERPFELFEAQRFDVVIGDKTYQYVKYVTQPANGSAGEIYYYCPEAPDNQWLKKAGADGTIDNASDVSLDSITALETKIEELMLTLYVDGNSVKIGEIISPAHFRSIALTLPNPEEHGGIYALKIPTDALYGYEGEATLPAVGYVVITIGAQEQGVLSGEIAYPGKLNIKADAVSETFTDLDIYRDESHTDGRDGLIGDKFMENVFAYRVYIESDDNKAYLYAKFEPNDTTLVSLEELSGATLDVNSATGIVTATINMTDLTEKVIRLKKTDSVGTNTLESIVYKITIVKKAEYKIELNPLDKIYDGMAVKPSVKRLYDNLELKHEETENLPTENLTATHPTTLSYYTGGRYGYKRYSTNSILNLSLSYSQTQNGNGMDYVVTVNVSNQSNTNVTSDSNTFTFHVQPSKDGLTITGDNSEKAIAYYIYNSNYTFYLRAKNGKLTIDCGGENTLTLFELSAGKPNVTTNATDNRTAAATAANAAFAAGEAMGQWSYTDTITQTLNGSVTATLFQTSYSSGTNTSVSAGTDQTDYIYEHTTSVSGTYTLTSEDIIPTEAELNSVEYTYYRQDGTAWTPIGAAPKDAGTYKVSAKIAAVSYNATSETQFTISKRTVTVNRIEYPLTYVSSAEYAGWTGTGTTHPVENPGKIFLNNVISGDDLSATAASIFYNDITIGYKADKITLEGITLSGASADNYETAATQQVFGQISYKLDQAIFKKKPGHHWDKFYPVDSKDPVKPETADYHSPPTTIDGNKVYETHGDHVYARTENTGEDQSIYAVDIEFGAMYFSYSKSQWNPNTMTYEELADESRWTGFDGGNNCVTVINRSNRAVYYAPHVRIDFLHSAIGDSTTGIKANFYKTNADTGTIITGIKQELSAATAGNTAALGTASRRECYIRLSGVPQLADSEQFTVVGGVTVTLSRTNE